MTACNKACTYRELSTTEDSKTKAKLIAASVICLFFLIGEVIGGVLSNSLAILTDSAHLFSDLSSFLIGLAALYVARWPPSDSMTFGWHRAEVLGALVSVLFIWAVTGVLVYSAILRLIHRDFIINATIMLIMSAIALMVNVVMALVLHPHSHSHTFDPEMLKPSSASGGEDDYSNQPLLSDMESEFSINDRSADAADYTHLLPTTDCDHGHHHSGHKHTRGHQSINLRAAFIHVIGDIIQSLGTLVSAFIIYFKPEYKIADPICTFVFCALVILTTVTIMRDIVNILLERRPHSLPRSAVVSARLASIPGVREVHSLQMWSLSNQVTAVMVHLNLGMADDSADTGASSSQSVLRHAYRILQRQFAVTHIAVQIEPYISDVGHNDIGCHRNAIEADSVAKDRVSINEIQ